MNKAKNELFWYTLITELKAKKQISTGLTIPYLIGAYTILGQPLRGIDHLVQIILNSSIKKYPLIQRCHEIEQHVVMLEEKSFCNNYYKDYVRFVSSAAHNYLFISNNTSLGKTIERVCWNLNAEYSGPIQRGQYSWNKKAKQWQSFDRLEIETIKDICK